MPSMGARVMKEPSNERREALVFLEEAVEVPDAPLAVADPLPTGDVPVAEGEDPVGVAWEADGAGKNMCKALYR